MPHVIRLRDPWETLLTEDGTLRQRRAFQKPTGLGAGDVVRLVIEGAAGLRTIAVNEQPQAAPPAEGIASFDITELLQPRNFIELALVAGGHRGEVRLEITAAG
ncbi:MAG: hypothetical protein C0483_01875 [Pirellula sp.]|nr:hypothetical protein [Pirellula sp.]